MAEPIRALTIDDLQLEYNHVFAEYNYWADALKNEPDPSLGLRGQVMALQNQAAALECLYRRLAQPGRWAIPSDDRTGYVSAAVDLLAARIAGPRP